MLHFAESYVQLGMQINAIGWQAWDLHSRGLYVMLVGPSVVAAKTPYRVLRDLQT